MKPKIDLDNIYNGNLPWLLQNTLFLTLHGSMAYGTNTPTSDIDLKGVAVPPKEYFLGFLNNFEQAELSKPYDGVIYNIQKFFKLAIDCNPSVLEILFTDPDDHYLIALPFMKVIENKELFLSKKAKHTFSGYATSQLHKIKSHRNYILSPMKAPPCRSEFGLPEHTKLSNDNIKSAEALIKKQIERWEIDFNMISDAERIKVTDRIASVLAEINLKSEEDLFNLAAKTIGFNSNFIEYLNQERLYQTRKREWDQYQDWKVNRNKARSELEVKYGYDTKHGMMLKRLCTICEEILTGKGVIVKRPDAEELLAIRNGAWSYEKLLEWAHGMDARLNELAKTSLLPNAPDRVKLDSLLIEVIEDFYETNCQSKKN